MGERYPSNGQQSAILGVSVFSSLLSILGSGSIIFLILKKKKWKKAEGGMFYRLLLGVSSSDILSSFGMVIAPYSQPRSSGFVFSRGTTATCSLAGSLLYATVCGLFYNCFLAVFFYRTIVKNDREAVKISEKWMHITSISVYLVLNTTILILKGYNPAITGGFCTIEYYPWGCQDDSSDDCTRGAHTRELGVLCIILMGIPSAAGVVLTVLVYRHVRRVFNASQTYRHETQQQENRRNRQVACQAVWYCVAYVNVLLWAISIRIYEGSKEDPRSIMGKPEIFSYLLIQAFFFPLQGFVNFLNYVRPRFEANRKRYSDRSCFYALFRVYNSDD